MLQTRSSAQFAAAFENLALPVTTANERLLERWSAREVWSPFWAIMCDFVREDEACREVIDLVFSGEDLSTHEHRALLQDFVDRRIPGYKLVFEADVLDALHEVMAKMGSNERVLGFRYGKDGRGAMPDRYYHLLFGAKYLMIGNHHDILGHLILLTDPKIRALTERLSKGFSAALETEHQMRRTLAENEANARTAPLRKILRLYTLAWNLCQEKLYLHSVSEDGEPVLTMAGAFNSVYNTIFSSKLPLEQVRSVSGAIGFFNRNPRESILIPPEELRAYCADCPGFAGERVQAALANHAKVWRDLGVSESSTELTEAFEKIVSESLFARGWIRQPSIRERWLKFSKGVLADENLKKIFHKPTLLAFSEAIIELNEALFAR